MRIIPADDLIDFASCPVLAHTERSIALSSEISSLRSIASFYLPHLMEDSSPAVIKKRWQTFSKYWNRIYEGPTTPDLKKAIAIKELFGFLSLEDSSFLVGVSIPCRTKVRSGTCVEASALALYKTGPIPTVLHISSFEPGVDLNLYAVVSGIGNQIGQIRTLSFIAKNDKTSIAESLWDDHSILAATKVVVTVGKLIDDGLAYPNPATCDSNCPVHSACPVRQKSKELLQPQWLQVVDLKKKKRAKTNKKKR